jgi:hypothetical protein
MGGGRPRADWAGRRGCSVLWGMTRGGIWRFRGLAWRFGVGRLMAGMGVCGLGVKVSWEVLTDCEGGRVGEDGLGCGKEDEWGRVGKGLRLRGCAGQQGCCCGELHCCGGDAELLRRRRCWRRFSLRCATVGAPRWLGWMMQLANGSAGR